MNELASAISKYLERGFGSMNKNDFEVWIFHYLLQNELNGKSNFDISVELRIPEQKVKRLKYEAGLKYGSPQDKQTYASNFATLLTKAQLKRDGSRVQFVVEDLQLRKYLDALLKKEGRFSNTSFNTEIVSIDVDDLEFLMKTIWPNDDWDAIYEKAKKLLNTNEVTFKGLLNKIAEGAAGQVGKQLFNLTYTGILTMLKNYGTIW